MALENFSYNGKLELLFTIFSFMFARVGVRSLVEKKTCFACIDMLHVRECESDFFTRIDQYFLGENVWYQ